MATFSSAPIPPAFTSYSSFFSSGLLAPHTPRRSQRRGTVSSDASEGYAESDSEAPPSPSQPSSPGAIPLPDDSVMDIDMADFAIANNKGLDIERRSATPTPHTLTRDRDGSTTPMQSPRMGKASVLRPHHQSQSPLQTEGQTQAQAQAQPPTQLQPRLRRRRSSLTQAASPMAAIRSPARAAGNALQLQMARGRSGSLGGDASVATVAVGGGGYHTRSSTAGVATEATSLIGRMRSGSCSNVAPGSSGAGASNTPLTVRPRRALRRILTTPVPGLRAPPPTAPLPALPPVPSVPRSSSIHELEQQQQLHSPAKVNFGPGVQSNYNPSASTGSSGSSKSATSQVAATSARARGLSVSSSTLSGNENRIDEDMKEN